MQPLTAPPVDADHVLGRLDAPLIVVEYGDYDCPHTRRAHGILKQLIAESPRSVALVFRPFPLTHLHQNAQALAELMQAIRDPEQFWAAHERLMAVRRMSLELAEQELATLGLSLVELASRGPEARLQVLTQVERGLRDGVHSTPSFFFYRAPHAGHYAIEP